MTKPPSREFASRPEPSRDIGVRYDQRVRWGRFVGFETDDRGLLACVAFHDATDDEAFGVVAIDRVIGLNGSTIEGGSIGMTPLELPGQDAEVARLRAGIERIAQALEYGPHSAPAYAAADLRALIGSNRCRTRWRAGILNAPGDRRIDGARCTLTAGHYPATDHKIEETP